MPTGDEFVNAALKRFLSQNRIANELIDYLQENSFDVLSRVFNVEGLFTYPVTIATGATFSLSVSPAGPIVGTDGLGHVLSLSLARQAAIPFEAAISSTYWIGMKYIEIPNELYDNQRTGKPEYDKTMEEIGELNIPDLVVDAGGGQITLTVDTILEGTSPANVDHTGRVVRVWLVNPQSGDEAVAFEDVTVAYSAGNNTITTTGSLGQGTISTLPANYQVAALGVTVRKSVSNPFSSEYIILGNIAIDGGGGQTATDQAEQNDYSGGQITLDRAYDGVGAGAGRIITVDSTAVELVQSNLTIAEDDLIQAALRLRKNDVVTDPITPPTGPSEWECGIDAKMRFNNRGSLLHRVHYWDWSGNDELRESEDVSVSGGPTDILTFDRGAVDLDLGGGANGKIWPDVDIVELYDSGAGNNGIYIVRTVTGTPTNTLQLWQLDHVTAAVLATEAPGTLKARLFRPVAFIGGNQGGGLNIRSLSDFADDIPQIDDVFRVEVPVDTVDGRIIGRFKRDGGAGVIIYADGRVDTQKGISVASGYSVESGAQFNLASGDEETEWYYIDGATGFSEHDVSPAHEHTWRAGQLAPDNPAAISNTVTGATKRIYYPLRLPHGSVIKSYAALVADKGGTSTVTLKLFRSGLHTWSVGTEAIGARSQVGSTQTSSSGAALELLEETGLSVSVNSFGAAYHLVCEDNEDPGGAIVHALRVEFEWGTVRL